MIETTLHPAIGRNRYCGPGALAIVTGHSTDDAAKLLRHLTGRRAIYGVGPHWMMPALRALGFAVAESWAPREGRRVRLADFVMGHVPSTGTWLLRCAGHYMVLELPGDGSTGWLADNNTVHPMPWPDYRKLSRHVKEAWKLVRINPTT